MTAKFRAVSFSFYFFEIFFFVLFLAVLGLHRCTWVFSSCCKKGLLFVAVLRLLVTVACFVVEHRYEVHGLRSWGTWA